MRDVTRAEFNCDVLLVFFIRVLKHVGAEEAVDDAFNHTRWMIGQGADVLVEVHWFLVSFGDNSFLLNCNG